MSYIKNIFRHFFGGDQPLEKLISRGLKVGTNFNRMSGALIDPTHCWHIEIGNDVTLGHYSQIIAHDASTKIFLNYTRVSKISIGNRVFIGAGSIILPGVTIGNDVIVGAGSIVTKDIQSNSVVVGSPAKFICTLEEYLSKIKDKMNTENCFDGSFTLRNRNFGEFEVEKLIETEKKFGEIYIE